MYVLDDLDLSSSLATAPEIPVHSAYHYSGVGCVQLREGISRIQMGDPQAHHFRSRYRWPHFPLLEEVVYRGW